MICVISGTSRAGSNGLKVARHVTGIYEEMGETVELLDLAGLPDGSFSESVFKEKPADLEASYTDKVLASDGVLVVVPEYNGSYPGILKHFIDLLPFPESFECRPVAFIGIAGGYYGGLRAVEQLQMVFAYRNAYLFNRRVFIPSAYSIFDEEGGIKDEDLKERLKLQSSKFLAFTKALKGLEG
ncbi:MAG: NADPH-dependent FMN reductase [Puniceicoccaceae bacterium]